MFTKIQLTKIEAARRQLRCAIRLWFADEDAVAIYTLAYAAHEVAHTLHKQRGGKHGLVFDSPALTPKGKQIVERGFKARGNFLKHADRDPDGSIEFVCELNEPLMLATGSTLHTLTGEIGMEELSFHFWMERMYPEGFRDTGANEEFKRLTREFREKAAFFDYLKANWGTKFIWAGTFPKADGF